MPPREAGVMVQQLDVVCGDVSIDLSEDLLFGEAGLFKSLSASSRKSDEAHGVHVAVSSIPQVGHPAPSSEFDAAAAPAAVSVDEGSESRHTSPPVDAGAAAVSGTAIAESPLRGRVVKVPEKVSVIHMVTTSHRSILISCEVACTTRICGVSVSDFDNLLECFTNLYFFALKIGFSLPKLSLKCSYKEGVLENVVTGIQMKGNRVQPTEPSRDLISQLDLGMECGEIMVSVF